MRAAFQASGAGSWPSHSATSRLTSVNEFTSSGRRSHPTAHDLSERVAFDAHQDQRQSFTRPLELAKQRPLACIKGVDARRILVIRDRRGVGDDPEWTVADEVPRVGFGPDLDPTTVQRGEERFGVLRSD